MISRIYVAPKENQKGRKNQTVISSYLLEHNLPKEKLQKVASLLTNPLLETASINTFPKHIPGNFNFAVEIGFLPGVTDNVGNTVQEIITDFFHFKDKTKVAAYSSKIFLIADARTENEVKRIVGTLHNPLIERAAIMSRAELAKKKTFPLKVPKVVLEKATPVINVPLDVSSEELTKIGKEGILDPKGFRRGPLALSLSSMQVIQEHFKKLKREPTDIELESLAQTWSEHCKHTIFANPIDDIKDGLYKTYIQGATNLIRKRKGDKDFCVSVFKDNSGAIVFDKDFLITHKVETHNSPSGLDPFGGAITGIVGVNRDTIGFGLGAKPVANAYGFCFGYPEDERQFFRDPPSLKASDGQAKKERHPMLLPKRIMAGVIKGINSGGNCSGIPTLNGFIKFDDRYRAKPLVFAGTVGLIPRKVNGKPAHVKKAKKGDYIVMIGGRVGQDGIHGATFSSVATDSNSPATAVQIGDPITQKKLSDAVVKEARDLNLYTSITDNGAGGLSCSVAEMAKESGGATVALEKVPLKYPGLRPWEIWISESQERMTLSVPKSKWQTFKKLMESRGVEATVIGEFTNSGHCVVNWHNKKIMDLSLEFLHDGLPKEKLYTEKVEKVFDEPKSRHTVNLAKVFEALLSVKNVSGFSFISDQYDHEVQSSSVLKPLSGAGRINTDAQVMRPVLSSNRGVVVSSALYPSYGDISAYDMAACAIDTAIRNAVCAGAPLGHLALLDNFCWCSSYDKKRLGELVDAVRACYDVSVGFGTPFISGKDSMFNDFRGYDEKGNPVAISVPPTILISAISVIPDISKTVSPEFKHAGDVIYLLGETHCDMGASEFFKLLSKEEGVNALGHCVPKVDVRTNVRTYRALEKVIQKELVNSALSLTSGGLGVALAKASLGGMLGCTVALDKIKGRNVDAAYKKLFSESQGRILVSVPPKNEKSFLLFVRNIPHTKLGTVTKDNKLIIKNQNKVVVQTSVKKLHTLYHKFSNSMKK